VSASEAPLSRRAQRIEVSPTVLVAQRAAALRAAGERILDFSVGEPDQATPLAVTAAAIEALEAGRTRYVASSGLPELRAAVTHRYKKDFHVSFAEDEVAITTGGKQALYLACQALLDRGDEVILPTPHWPTFTEAVRLAGARPILVRAAEKDGFQINARMISKATSARTKAVIINSPCNPTGAVIDPEDLLVIGDIAQRRKFTILYDDTYARLSFGRVDPAVFQALRDAVGERFVIVGTASKTYCMTGWRIGWILGSRSLIDASSALISHSTQGPATFAQHGAVQALTGPQRSVQEMAAEYRRRRDLVYPAVRALPRVTCAEPAGGFYVFPNLGRYLSAEIPSTLELCRRLLDEQRVALVPGEGFGAPGYVRLSFARPATELEDGLKRIAIFLSRLKVR
jgi:aspartate aminotransferase